jgi:YHS domain-containing protein
MAAEHDGGPAGPAGAPAPVAAPPATAAPAFPASSRAAAPARSSSTGPEVGLPRLGVSTEMVNSVCPVCGVEVDASLPTSMYHGRIIGFGCRPNRCKEKFDADPERYGPAALANRKAE